MTSFIAAISRSALKSVPPTAGDAAFLAEVGREGNFVCRAGTAPLPDPEEGVYVVSSTSGFYWERVFSGKLHVTWFGADKTGLSDSAPAFQGAAGFGRCVWVDDGSYRLNSTPSVTLSGTKFEGSGPGKVVITTYSAGHGFVVQSGLYHVEFEGFKLLRFGVPTSDAQNGIHFIGLTERARVARVNSEGHWHNFRLCATSLSRCENIFSNNAYGNGVDQTNEDCVAAGMQWEINFFFVQCSNGYGHRIYSNFGTTSNIATVRGWWSFANRMGGVYVQGQATHPINGCRWIDGFSGEEGSDSMRIDSYGTVDIQISGIQTEINGTAANGVNHSYAPTNAGRGFTITANNTNVIFTGCTALGHAYSGLVTSCPRYTITGCSLRANGKAKVGGERSGIYLAAGHGSCVGNTSWGHLFGIYFQNDNHTITGNDLSEGNTFPLAGAVTPVNSRIGYNLGTSIVTAA